MMTIDWPALKQIIDDNERFVLTSHIRPDCDALGSALGMALVLEALGKDVRIVNGMAAPPNLDFIDPDGRIETLDEGVTAEDLADRQVHLVLDTSAWAQLGPMADVYKNTLARKIVMDHHVGEDDLGAEFFKDRQSPATGQIVFEAAEYLGVTLTKEMAIPLYAAIATDTGWYRFNSTTSTTYRTAAALMDAGADPAWIYGELYEKDTLSRLRLRGLITSRTATKLDGRVAYTYVERADLAATGALATDTEDVINLTLTVEGVEVAVIMVELEDGRFKLSFRSRCDVNCAELAQEFGGGGHKAAAGAAIEGPLETAQPKVLDAVLAAMR